MGYDLNDIELDDDEYGPPGSAGSVGWGGLQTVDETGTDTDRPGTAGSYLSEAAEEQFETLYQDLAESHPEVQQAHKAELAADSATNLQLRKEADECDARVLELDEKIAGLFAAFQEAEQAGTPTDKINDELAMAKKELEAAPNPNTRANPCPRCAPPPRRCVAPHASF